MPSSRMPTTAPSPTAINRAMLPTGGPGEEFRVPLAAAHCGGERRQDLQPDRLESHRDGKRASRTFSSDKTEKEIVGVSLETHYDSIAESYRDSKGLPFRSVVERYTLFELLGDLRGRTILDLACGEGFYTRRFKRAGAAEATGVDISRAMIELAEAEEKARPIGCRYVCADAAAYEPGAGADIVTAVYLLNYARNQSELEGFCRACFAALRPGGLLVGFNDNVRRPPQPGGSLAKYGFERTAAAPLREGDVIRYRITSPGGGTIEVDNYYLKPCTYETEMERAGFRDFQ